MSTSPTRDVETDVTILARVLANGEGQLPRDVASYLLNLGFSERDKARMHELAARNQEDALSPAEKEVLEAYGKVSDILSILKARARRTLGVASRRNTRS